MANVTDPLAQPIHGTNPQNLIEYITRQRIYDSQYWKEQCFGLTAADVVEKAATHLQAIGGSYGGNSKPTRFLSLILKMLQIQPEEEIVDELINNEDFKYVRALGIFYLRLTGRPAEIYEKLEPLYNDYRKLKFRNPTDWKLMHMDEFVDELLTDERVCGIALPRLPKREMLEDAGYLDGPRQSAVQNLLETSQNDDQGDDENARYQQYTAGVKKIKSLLREMAADGNIAAENALSSRNINMKRKSDSKEVINDHAPESDTKKTKLNEDNNTQTQNGREQDQSSSNKRKKEKKKDKSKKKFGSLFKAGKNSATNEESPADASSNSKNDENSDEYWNEQRAKLGLKPLKK